MTDIQINRKIAEICGWGRVMPIPNFAEKLDAMHEAEKTLDEGQKDSYRDILDEICRRDWVQFKSSPFPVFAEARQRAEAFLSLHGSGI